MNREIIDRAARDAVQNHFQCNGKYPCEGRDYCEFCNGHNSAFDCKEDCGADDFNEGFFAGAEWCVNSVWHNIEKELPDIGMHVVNEDWFDFVADDERDLNRIVKQYEFKRWAYVKDLLPDGGRDADG